MSFSYDTKIELSAIGVQKVCCARAEAYGILLYCNTFSSTEVRIVTENPHFAARLPKLFHKAFGIRFDRQPEEEQQGKLIFQITDGKKLDRIMIPGRIWCCTSILPWWRSPAAALPFCGVCSLPAAASPIP